MRTEDQFDYLREYPNVYEAMLAVHRRMEMRDYDVAVQKMRTVLQGMVKCIFEKYRSAAYFTLNEQIQILQGAGLISPDTAAACFRIKNKGNAASHEAVDFSEAEARGLYVLLLGESVLFAEKYMKNPDPKGNKRILAYQKAKDRRPENNKRFSPMAVRISGCFHMAISSLIFFGVIGTSPEIDMGVGLLVGLCFFLMIFGTGLYGVITGSDKLLILMLY